MGVINLDDEYGPEVMLCKECGCPIMITWNITVSEHMLHMVPPTGEMSGIDISGEAALPEAWCGCERDSDMGRPILSDEDYEKIKDTPFFQNYGDDLFSYDPCDDDEENDEDDGEDAGEEQ